MACLRLGRLQEAADNFHRAVNTAPELAEAWFNLGIVHERLQRWEDAASCHEKAALAAPTYCKAWEARARMAWELGQFQQVVPLYERALALKEDHLPAHRGLLQFLGQSNQPEALAEALARARQALGEEHPLARLHEGFMADAEGKLEQARACLEGIVIDDAGDGASAEEDLGSLHDERLRLARLVRLCDQLDAPDAAMEHARAANRLAQKMAQRRGVRKETFLGFVENRRRYFTPENVRQWGETRDAAPSPEGQGPDSAEQPVFIIGFPRSGTTLLDSLLRGHPDLEVFEETDAVSSLVNRLAGPADEDLSRLARLSEQEAAALRALYFEGLARRRAAQNATEQARPGATTVDRFALNIIYLGELCRVFPQARFILALRHPADCVLSCFMQTFYETSANASFHTLEDAAHLYDAVFSLWRQQMEALKPKLIQVKYEVPYRRSRKNLPPGVGLYRRDLAPGAVGSPARGPATGLHQHSQSQPGHPAPVFTGERALAPLSQGAGAGVADPGALAPLFRLRLAPLSDKSPGGAGEQPLHHGGEVLQGARRIGRVKRALIPAGAEIHAGLVIGMVFVAVPRVFVLAVMLHPVIALKQPVVLDHPVVFFADVGAQHGGGDFRMVVGA